MESNHKWINIKWLKTKNVFETLFSRSEEMVDKIAQHMKDHGYDDSQANHRNVD